MEINISNYEIFIVDYLDNKLSALQTAELFLFLENHPELKEEFEDLKGFTVIPESKEYFGFNESLKQPADLDALYLSVDNYPHYFIAAFEGDLSQTGYKSLNSFIEKHPELVGEYNLYKAAKVKPELRIKYPEKDKLKVKGKQLFIRYCMATAIAASLLLLFSVYLRLTPETDDGLYSAMKKTIEQQANDNKEVPGEKIVKDETLKSTESIDTKGTKDKSPSIKNGEIKNKPKIKSEIDAVEPLKKIEKRGVIINTVPLFSQNKRSFYTDLYDDIRLSQDLALARDEEQEENQQTEQNTRNVKAARILSSVFNTGDQLAEQVPQSINGWLIADLGIKGFNFLTNNNYSLERKFKPKGGIEELQFVKSENR